MPTHQRTFHKGTFYTSLLNSDYLRIPNTPHLPLPRGGGGLKTRILATAISIQSECMLSSMTSHAAIQDQLLILQANLLSAAICRCDSIHSALALNTSGVFSVYWLEIHAVWCYSINLHFIHQAL